MLTPQQNDFTDNLIDFEEVLEPTKAYIFNRDINKVVNTNSDIEALEQAILLYLSVERYDYQIYDFNDFFEVKDLFGKPTSYVASEVPRRITEALLQDDRITAVDSFNVTTDRNTVNVQYTVRSIYGEIQQEKEVIYG